MSRPLQRRLLTALAMTAWLPLSAGLAMPASAADAASTSRATAADGGLAQLRRFVGATPQASGRFVQQVLKDTAKDGGKEAAKGAKEARTSSGVFAYAKPGRFRWEIRKPYEQLIVTDGKELFFYDKDLQQVTVRPVSESMSATPAALLFGTADLDKAFKLSDDGQADGLAWVLATPTSKDAGFERVRVGLRDGAPARMEVDDAFGQRTRFDFEGLDGAATVDPDQFRFTPPPGVDIIR